MTDAPAAPARSELSEEDQIMRDLIEYIPEALVDQPEKVRVDVISGGTSCILELHVARDDVGKVIGRQGRTARAIRTLLAAAGMKVQKRFVLEILE